MVAAWITPDSRGPMWTSHQAKDFLKVVPVTVQAQTVSKLRQAILTGVFQPGERLVEIELCQRMGVSRPSIREALRCLEAERLITIIPNRGPMVTDITWEEATEIYDVRALLEGEAAALFAKRAKATECAALADALIDFEAAVAEDNPAERLAATSRFYDTILQGCGNRIIAEIVDTLLARINFLRAKSMSRSGRSRKSAEELRRIAEAIGRRDVGGARQAAVDHVHAACRAARSIYQRRDRASEVRPARQRALPRSAPQA